jgi:hypothetical protein
MRCEARLRITIIENIRISEKRTWSGKVDISTSITKRPLLLYINCLLVNTIDWSFNYLSDSLSIISCLYSCKKRISCCVRMAPNFLSCFHFNYLKTEEHQNLSFCWALCRRTEPRTKHVETDGIGSISIFSSRVSTIIF